MAEPKKPEEPTWTHVANFDSNESVFNLENAIAWLKDAGYNRHFTRTAPENRTELHVFAKPTEIRLAYSKEMYKRQQATAPYGTLKIQ